MNVKVGNSTKRADLAVWVKSPDNEWKAILIECKNYEGTYVGIKAIDQLLTYKNNLKKCDGSKVRKVLPIMCCRKNTNLSINTRNTLSSNGILLKKFDRGAFNVKHDATMLNSQEESFLEMIARIIERWMKKDDAGSDTERDGWEDELNDL